MMELLRDDVWLEVLGAVILYLLAFLVLAAAVLIPLFGGLAIRYTVRKLWSSFSQRKL